MLFLLFAYCKDTVLKAQASSLEGNSNITWSPDKEAFTTDSKERDYSVYPLDLHITVGSLQVPTLQEGEHFYNVLRTDDFPIYRWTVRHTPGRCVHGTVPEYYHGMLFKRTPCQGYYKSGWFPTCADCNREIRMLFYMDLETAGSITDLPAGKEYYYECPNCNHLEMGSKIVHECQKVSANRYTVQYFKNARDAVGFMQTSTFFYNNAGEYEGKQVVGEVALRTNTYLRSGFRFVGWNTQSDGSGETFTDGQGIWNLTAEQNGVIRLFARWEASESTLVIDAAGGSFCGQSGISRYTKRYGQEISLAANTILGPIGYQVRFDSCGGNPVGSKNATTSFDGWSWTLPLNGQYRNDIYYYLGDSGTEDFVTATYLPNPITLPTPVWEGHSFGGWYSDSSYEQPVGFGGDSFLPTSDCTLYAKWVELVLTATNNMVANQGKGAVNLSWQQKDGKGKTYLLYQRKEGEAFAEIAREGGEGYSIPRKTFSYTGSAQTYAVTDSGYYALTLFGAQGADYGEHSGGKGGKTSFQVYLEKGEILTFWVGGQNGQGSPGGGTGTVYGAGGGATKVTSKRLGDLAIAAGGGGASVFADGEPGGSDAGLRWDGFIPEGESGCAGGGGGIWGGRAGNYILHEHTEACVHKHLGDETVGGPCYLPQFHRFTCNILVDGPYIDSFTYSDCPSCGAKNTYQPRAWRVRHSFCGEETDWGTNGFWRCSSCNYVGYTWGSGTKKPAESTHQVTLVTFFLACNETYICPYKDNPIISAAPAYGGASYLNTGECFDTSMESGVNMGNGYAVLTGIRVGFEDQTQKEGVLAPDLEAPEKIDLKTVTYEPAEDSSKVLLQWREPKDVGTLYYHQAESYLARTGEWLCTSNQTVNEIISGVAGYVYRINEIEEDTVSGLDTFVKQPKLTISLKTGVQYLHIAAKDVAGNVSRPIHIRLSYEDTHVSWEPVTGPIRISSVVGKNDYESVAQKETGVYYVRCDGNTPFLLSTSGSLLGKARLDYQITRMQFLATEGIEKQTLLCRMALHSDQKDVTLLPSGLSLESDRELPLQFASYVTMKRSKENTDVDWEQAFTMDAGYHGKTVTIRPKAGVDISGETVFSKEEKDVLHAIQLIGDGEAPVIYGAETLQEVLVLDALDSGVLEFTAQDALSGVKSFQAIVENREDYSTRVYLPDGAGKIVLDFTENSALPGEREVTLEAVDRVGNVRRKTFVVSLFGMDCTVERVLEPHGTVFACGESGVLKIHTWGLADRVEITFSPVLSALDNGLNQTIEYPTPVWETRENVVFMIPMDAPQNQSYTITVKAYRTSLSLETKPKVLTITVEGTILNQLRTRLR